MRGKQLVYGYRSEAIELEPGEMVDQIGGRDGVLIRVIVIGDPVSHVVIGDGFEAGALSERSRRDDEIAGE